MRSELTAAFAAIDAANATDPNIIEWRDERWPRAQLQGVLATEWAEKIDPRAGDEVLLATRAHHVRRWTIPRDSYAEGRVGYLRWRRALKDVHAEVVAELLPDAGISATTVTRVQALVRKDGLGHDPETQLVEDAICLTFIETQFEDLAARLDHARLVTAVQKTVVKMSDRAVALVAQTRISATARAALDDALSQ
ncbi:MAG TPA: DUF4202 domain-containing protein [Acidimicrobiales bacterium]|nr:DUF4202 domain-containing protein [Acidimicrobiales bacterium]